MFLLRLDVIHYTPQNSTHKLIYLSIKAGSVYLVMLDLSAAFDTVNHALLLEQLEHDFGMEDNMLAWLGSYFSGRVQAVSINGCTSEPQPLQTGHAPWLRTWAIQFPLLHYLTSFREMDVRYICMQTISRSKNCNSQ